MIKSLIRVLPFNRRKPAEVGSLTDDTSGVAMVEFAFTAPILLTLGLLGAETANYVITHMQVSQIAMQVADNASRVGEQDVLVARKVYEGDINEVFVGADKLGERLGVLENGRIILSSLERNSDGGQWIHWQRCMGKKVHNSSYGNAGAGASGDSFPGMGAAGKEITASAGTAVMFVEIAYDYEALTPFDALDGNTITYTAAFNIRDARDLSRLYSDDTTPAQCNRYESFE